MKSLRSMRKNFEKCFPVVGTSGRQPLNNLSNIKFDRLEDDDGGDALVVNAKKEHSQVRDPKIITKNAPHHQ